MMGYRYSCDPIVVGAAGHEFLEYLRWATWIPEPEHHAGEWGYDVSGTKHPERPLPVLMAVAYLTEGRQGCCEVRGDDETDVRWLEIRDGAFAGCDMGGTRITWPWLAQAIRNMHPSGQWDVRSGDSRPDDQSMYAGYHAFAAAEILDALQPLLLKAMIDPLQPPAYGVGLPSSVREVAERFGLFGKSLAQCEAELRSASAALGKHDIDIPSELGTLLAGWCRHPNSW